MKVNKCFPVILQEWVMFSCRHAQLRLSPPAGESLPHQWGKALSVLTASLSTNTTAVYLWPSQWPIQSALSPPHSFLLPLTLQCTERTHSVLKRNLLSNLSYSDHIKQTSVIINVEIFWIRRMVCVVLCCLELKLITFLSVLIKLSMTLYRQYIRS